MTDNYVTTEQFAQFRKEEDAHHLRDENTARQMAADIAAVKKILFGNGEPGWDELLRDLAEDMRERKEAKKEKEKEDKENRTWLLRWVIALVVPNMLLTIGALLAWFIRIYPAIEAVLKAADK